MATKAEKRSVLDAIDGMQDEIVNAVSELVQIRSINPGYPGTDYQRKSAGKRKPIGTWPDTTNNLGSRSIYGKLSPNGPIWPASGRVPAEAGRYFSMATLIRFPPGYPKNGSRGHPLSGKVEGGRIYGRGSCDMKGRWSLR